MSGIPRRQRAGADFVLLALQTVTVLAIAAVAAFLLAQLAVDRFRTTAAQEVEGRYRIVLEEIRSIVEVGSDIGIPIADIPALRRLTARLGANDPDLLFADVMDADGIVIVSTDASNLGIPGPASWLRGPEAGKSGVWTRATQGGAAGTIVGQSVISSVGTVLATVVVGYSSASLRASIEEMRRRNLIIAISVAALGAAVNFLLVWGGLARLGLWLTGMEAAAEGRGTARLASVSSDVAATIQQGIATQQRLAEFADDLERGDG